MILAKMRWPEVEALDRADVTTITAEDLAEAARALGEAPAPEREQSRWWRWLLS